MQNNIFISGWGDEIQTKEFDRIYKEMLKGKNILYVPWAFYPNNYWSCKRWINNVFPHNEGYYVYMIAENDNIDLSYFVDKFDGIYIWWWNTFRLLKLIKKTWFYKVIDKFSKLQKPIYGGSAWAIILWKEINTSPDMNVVKLSLEETYWMDYFDGFSIFCHYNKDYDVEINDYVRNYNIPVIAISEWSWIYTKDSKLFLWWNKEVYIFDKMWKKVLLK